MALVPSSLGSSLISALIADGSMGHYLRIGKCEYLFEHSPAEKDLYEKFEQHIQKYGKIPAQETFEQDTGTKLPTAAENAEYYRDKLFDRHVHRSLVITSDLAAEHLTKKEAKEAFALIQNLVRKMEMEIIRPRLFDFRHSHDLIMQSIASKLSPTEKDGLDFGWPTFDAMSGGVRGGDLISFVGRPAVGKSFFSLYTALNAWHKQKKTILFISMEMAPIIIFERLSAMYTHIPANWLKTGGFPTLPQNTKKKFSKAIKSLEEYENPFYVVDGNLTATIDDLAALCHQLKPDAVFVDGAYLLKVNGKFGKYEKIGEIARGLKSEIATRHDVPVIASWQFNRDAMKVKKDEKIGLEHIAGSDEIGQLSSMVLGLFQEESAETVYKRKIDIMKGREGETGEIMTNWDFLNMDFSEYEDSGEIIF